MRRARILSSTFRTERARSSMSSAQRALDLPNPRDRPMTRGDATRRLPTRRLVRNDGRPFPMSGPAVAFFQDYPR